MKARAPVVIVLAASLLGGCVGYTKPMPRSEQLTAEQRRFEALWQGSLDALREYGFAVDRQDRRAGVITTNPLVAPGWFEFWRPDAVRPGDVVEGTVQTIYRTATVRIVPAAPGEQNYRADVEVAVARSSRAEAEVRSTSEAYNMFVLPGGDEQAHRPMLGYAMMGLTAPAVDPNSVVPLAKDRALAERLTREISWAASKRLLEGSK
jgi:hypothetical protein